MNSIIGVHFWERQARLSLCDAESVSTAQLDLPSDIKRLNIIANDFALKKAFEVIDSFIKEKMGISEYRLLMCVSDDTGLKEIQGFYRCAKECDIEVVGTVTETMAMAYYSYIEFGASGPVLMTFASPAKLAVAEYYIEEGLVEKEDTYIAGRWNGTSLAKAEFLTPSSSRLFDMTDAPIVLCSGTMDRALSFDQALKNHISTSQAFYNPNIEFKMIDSQSVIEGTGFICGKLERRPAFQGINAVDTLSPYELLVGINGEMFPIIGADKVIPCEEEIEIERYPESDKPYEDIRLYERRNNSFVQICRLNASKEQAEVLYKKPVKLKISADGVRKLKLDIKAVLGDNGLNLKIPDDIIDTVEETGNEENIEDFIAHILPIVDDLEYAVKYAKDGDNPYIQGILKTYNKAIQILNDNGVTLINGEGEPFDYNYQTAVAHVSDIELPDNTVKQVMQAGYIYKGKVIRTASVIVAN
ncbi:MAG: nucleotide exchange factor GrpE [Eubacterium sp.]|nr:nucleotide exchange factor GrpE [Eubacterium sp.]